MYVCGRYRYAAGLRWMSRCRRGLRTSSTALLVSGFGMEALVMRFARVQICAMGHLAPVFPKPVATPTERV